MITKKNILTLSAGIFCLQAIPMAGMNGYCPQPSAPIYPAHMIYPQQQQHQVNIQAVGNQRSGLDQALVALYADNALNDNQLELLNKNQDAIKTREGKEEFRRQYFDLESRRKKSNTSFFTLIGHQLRNMGLGALVGATSTAIARIPVWTFNYILKKYSLEIPLAKTTMNVAYPIVSFWLTKYILNDQVRDYMLTEEIPFYEPLYNIGQITGATSVLVGEMAVRNLDTTKKVYKCVKNKILYGFNGKENTTVEAPKVEIETPKAETSHVKPIVQPNNIKQEKFNTPKTTPVENTKTTSKENNGHSYYRDTDGSFVSDTVEQKQVEKTEKTGYLERFLNWSEQRKENYRNSTQNQYDPTERIHRINTNRPTYSPE